MSKEQFIKAWSKIIRPNTKISTITGDAYEADVLEEILKKVKSTKRTK